MDNSLKDYSHLAKPYKTKGWFSRLFCWHDWDCISWAWFRCTKCGKEEGV